MTAAHRRHRVILLTVAGIAVLALVLGLGLGLGLKHHHSSQSAAAAAASPSATAAPIQLQDQPGSNFVLNDLSSQPPQTRVFNFTLAQVQGAPDGFSRSMLVVNGTSVLLHLIIHP
jgi:hypothetical protein